MTDALKITGAALFVLTSKLFGILWFGLKVIIFLGVVVGALLNLSVVGDQLRPSLVENLQPWIGGTFFLWIATNWLTLAVLVMFLTIVAIRRHVIRSNQTGDYARIFMSTVLSYLSVEPEHDKMKILKEQGMFAALWHDLSEKLFSIVFGLAHDPQLECQPKRDGSKVSLLSDLQSSIERASATHGKDVRE